VSDLAQSLGDILGADIDDLRRLTGGASRATWAFTARTDAGSRRLILRTGPPDEVHAGMELEARVQALAAEQGAPVPEILACSNSVEPLGNPYLICNDIAGETIGRRIHRQLDDRGRARLLEECAAALAGIHRADPAAVGLTAEDQLARSRTELDAMHDTTATFEWAFRWLESNRPDPSPLTLVHGDFRMGNLIVDGSGLAAVLDWELVHAGDPREDLSWFCIRAWRFGAPKHLDAGGLGSVDEFLTAYERAGGAVVDRAGFQWWLVLSTLRWGVICRLQAERHLSGQTPSVELATIGRRVCETEWDLLNLLELSVSTARLLPGDSVPASSPGPSPTARLLPGDSVPASSPGPSLHGRPTAAELVGAVADFLDTDVRDATRHAGPGAAGQVNFHARVAANALRMVQRELTATGADRVAEALATLGVADEAQLAAAIRRGELDGPADDVTACLTALVRHRLTVAHPGYEQE
jgi:aminoglycoside phosphotransferase (APT) family kinase protein